MIKQDKTSTILIGFIVIFGISAALLATGIIPTIIDTVNVANQTKYESINQTAILQDFVTLYLANTLNDTKENTEALSAARKSIANQEQLISENRNLTKDLLNITTNQERILNENRNITSDILEISQEHKSEAQSHESEAQSHDQLQEKGDDLIERINNITQLSYQLLEKHALNVSEAEHRQELKEMLK